MRGVAFGGTRPGSEKSPGRVPTARPVHTRSEIVRFRHWGRALVQRLARPRANYLGVVRASSVLEKISLCGGIIVTAVISSHFADKKNPAQGRVLLFINFSLSLTGA